jgi:hypothetical protein
MEPIVTVAGSVAAVAALSDDELVDRVRELAAWERRASVSLIRLLVELDERKLYLREGCSSLFTYCTQVLHLSEGSAYNRIEAARAARRYPSVLQALECGDLTLSAVRLLAPHLTRDNYARVLAAARHRSKLEIQELVASLSPQPAAATIIRRVAQHGAAPSVPGVDAAVVTPLAPDAYRLQVTLTRETHDKLRRAQVLSRHTLPRGNVAALLDRALTLLVDHLERRICAGATSPRRGRGHAAAASGRHIPARVRRAVWKRDEARCAFVGRLGRCRETAFLEFHLVQPYADGGPSTIENIELRCRAHNQHEARQIFGDSLARDAQEVPRWP